MLNTLGRDGIVAPRGGPWKITVLRDSLDAKAWDEAWEHELSFESGVDDGGSEACTRKQCAALGRTKVQRHAFFHPR